MQGLGGAHQDAQGVAINAGRRADSSEALLASSLTPSLHFVSTSASGSQLAYPPARPALPPQSPRAIFTGSEALQALQWNCTLGEIIVRIFDPKPSPSHGWTPHCRSPLDPQALSQALETPTVTPHRCRHGRDSGESRSRPAPVSACGLSSTLPYMAGSALPR